MTLLNHNGGLGEVTLSRKRARVLLEWDHEGLVLGRTQGQGRRRCLETSRLLGIEGSSEPKDSS